MQDDWKELLGDFLQSNKMQELKQWLVSEMNSGKNIFPHPSQWLASLGACSFKDVKVVVIGQDPYHGKGQGNGLAFSVNRGVRIPPSLLNIYKEMNKDIGLPMPEHGDLTSWASQGVLLINNVLTVEESKANSHQGKGWEDFTDLIVESINKQKRNVVFILWGRNAQTKGKGIDRQKHLVLESAHPSPLSSSRGFFGSKPFSKCNEYLYQYGIEPINWRIK